MEGQSIFYVAELLPNGYMKLFCADVALDIKKAKELAASMANASKKTFRIIEVPVHFAHDVAPAEVK